VTAERRGRVILLWDYRQHFAGSTKPIDVMRARLVLHTPQGDTDDIEFGILSDDGNVHLAMRIARHRLLELLDMSDREAQQDS
jgi:hypothetical protein